LIAVHSGDQVMRGAPIAEEDDHLLALSKPEEKFSGKVIVRQQSDHVILRCSLELCHCSGILRDEALVILRLLDDRQGEDSWHVDPADGISISIHHLRGEFLESGERALCINIQSGC